MQQNFWMIRSGRNSLSLRDTNKTYVIGFPQKDIANRVANNISTSLDTMRLKRSMVENVALDVKRSMMEMELPIAPVADTITIDVAARLSIQKSLLYKGYNISDIADIENTIEEIDNNEFMMLPFKSRLGVIMPYDLLHEDENEYEFLCNVIDPADSVNNFLQNGRLNMY